MGGEALHIGGVIERFTIEDVKEMISAWRSLEDSVNHQPKDIVDDMKPIIDKFRAKIKNTIYRFSHSRLIFINMIFIFDLSAKRTLNY